MQDLRDQFDEYSADHPSVVTEGCARGGVASTMLAGCSGSQPQFGAMRHSLDCAFAIARLQKHRFNRSGAMVKLHRFAQWLALALFVLMGGELVLGYVASLLGVHRLGDIMTPQALLAMAAGPDAAELCLALFGVYAILQAPLSSIGFRRPKVAGLHWGSPSPWRRAYHNSAGAGVATAEQLQSSVRALHHVSRHRTDCRCVILCFCIFYPIVEEILFRGIVLGGLLNVTNGVVAVVLSTTIFAAIHWAGGVAQITSVFILGLVLGWLYLRTRSIVPSSVAHIIYNAVAFYPIILYMVRGNRF